MEDEKKKKKNKKKKNKQNKAATPTTAAAEDNVTTGGDDVNVDHNHVSEESNHASVIPDVCNGDAEKDDSDRGSHRRDGSELSVVAETERESWLQREASLEETIKQLQNEKDSHLQKGALLEMRVVELEYEKESWIRKEASLEEKIAQLLEEKATLSFRGANFEERVKHLEREKDLWVLNEVNLEERIKFLEGSNDSWILKENSTIEMIANLNEENTRLRRQVRELEESRHKLFQENQMLVENISSLQRIQNHESVPSSRCSTDFTKMPHAYENEDTNSQMEAARSLVDKLVTEDVKPVDEVSELYMELDRRSSTAGIPPAILSDPAIGSANIANSMRESSYISTPSERMDPPDAALNDVERNCGVNSNVEGKPVTVNSPGTIDSAEIVQIPLDETEEQEVESQLTVDTDEKADVALTDAPLIGAPFRLISFVAKYVSGADLVK